MRFPADKLPTKMPLCTKQTVFYFKSVELIRIKDVNTQGVVLLFL